MVAYEEEKDQTLKQVLQTVQRQENLRVGILIGPEGGISMQEMHKLQQAPTKTITLGNRILRTETAPIAMTSILMYELE